MPPRSSALFTLVPKPSSEAAKGIINHLDNCWLVSTLPDGSEGLDIGPHIASGACDTLATLGRADCDITVEEPSISRLQCEFHVLSNGIVLLWDHSSLHSTEILGENQARFCPGCRHEVILTPNWSSELDMGMGPFYDEEDKLQYLVHFVLRCHVSIATDKDDTEDDGRDVCKEVLDKMREYYWDSYRQEGKPLIAQKISPGPTVLPAPRVTRIHAPSIRLNLKYDEADVIEKGLLARSSPAVDMNSGRLITVKRIHVKQDKNESQEQWRVKWYRQRNYLKREIETLSRLRHVRA